MKNFILAMLLLAPLVVGCASTKTVTVRTQLPPPGTAGKATTTVVAPQQKHVAPAEEDPLVLQARAVALQNIKDREVWKAACFELRRIDMYMTYEDCRRILGDERYIGSYGRSVGGSVINNSRGVGWR